MRDVVSSILLLMLFRLFSLVLSNKTLFRNAWWFEKAIRPSEPDTYDYDGDDDDDY